MRKLIGAVAILTALAAPAGAQEWPAQAGQPDRAVLGRRHHRPVRTPARPAHAPEIRPALHRGKPRGRRRQSRCRRGREGRARRLHVSGRHGVDPRHQPVHLYQAALRHREGLPAGQPDRAPAEHSGGAPKPAGEKRPGIDRVPEGQPGQDVLRVLGRRHVDPSRRRAVQDQDRHDHDARAVPLVRRHHEQPDRRPYQSGVRQHHARLAAGESRKFARARGVFHRAQRDRAGRADGGGYDPGLRGDVMAWRVRAGRNAESRSSTRWRRK